MDEKNPGISMPERGDPFVLKQGAAAEYQQSVIGLAQKNLLEECTPAAVAIDQNCIILFHNGPTNKYLRQPRGTPTQNLPELLPKSLMNRIRGGLHRVTREECPVSIRTRIPGAEGRKRQVTLSISKLQENLFLIVFREKAAADSSEAAPAEEAEIRQLESELAATRTELQSNIEQLSCLNEELRSSNEELETSYEELQSLNEELDTVNSQLQSTIEEQAVTNNDLNNFLTSTNIPTVFLDCRFKVKRFTPAMSTLLKFISSDIGRPISDLSQDHLGPDLIADAQVVLEHLAPIKKEIKIGAAWYVRAALPYKTFGNRVEGVVITYTEVTDLKRAEEASERIARQHQLALDAAHMGWWHYDPATRTVSWDDRYRKIFGITGYQHPNDEILARIIHPEDLPGVWAKVEAALDPVDPQPFAAEYRINRPDGLRRWIEAHGVATFEGQGESRRATSLVGTVADITERKQTEIELWRLSQFPKENPNPVLRIDADETLSYANAPARDWLETLDWQPDKPLPAVVRAIAATAARQSHAIATEIVNPAGSTLWISAVQPAGEDYVNLYGRDITGRKRTEEALLEREGRLNRAQEVAHLGSWELDIVNNRLTWSDEVYRIFGLEPREFMATYEAFMERVHPDDRAAVDASYFGSLREGRDTYEIEHRVVRMDTGEIRYVHEKCEHLRDKTGKITRSVGMVHDITERQRAEEALQRSLRWFELLAETAGELLQAREPQKVVESVCRKVLEYLDCHTFFNFLVDEKAGKLHLNACAGIPAEEARRIEWLDFGVAVCGCAARDGCRIVAEHIPTTPDERTELVKSYGIKAYCCHPLLGPGGKLIGTLSFGTCSRETFSEEDISLMKAITDQVAVAMIRMNGEQALRQRSRELETSNKELESFIYSVAHDLKNPLRTIFVYSQFLDKDSADRLGSEDRAHLDRIRKSTAKMSGLIEDILYLSQISRQDAEREKINMSRLAWSIITGLQAGAPSRDVGITIQDDLTAFVDPKLMAIVLSNLLGNAWKFTSKTEGARIEFGAVKNPPRYPSEEGTIYYVRDNGVGFEPEYAVKMFRPFHRFHTDEEFEGSGIGLTIVERVVHRHGGEVWAEGETGKGTTIYFTLGVD